MRHRRFYICLALLVVISSAICLHTGYKAQAVSKGYGEAVYADGWPKLIAAGINGSPIYLEVDGKPVDTGDMKLYMNEDRTLMLPESILRRVFRVSSRYYDGQRLVIEKNTTVLELYKDAFMMKVNGMEQPLETPMLELNGELYVPSDVFEEYLEYEVNWSKADSMLSMVNRQPDARSLPVSYDYRKEGRATTVRDQGDLGTCWAFAALNALQTSLMPEQQLLLSADHMSLQSGFSITQDDGGDYAMSLAYLAAWKGPVLEEEDPYGDGTSPAGLSPVAHVQEAQMLPRKDYEKIKEAVFLYGGVQTSIHMSLSGPSGSSDHYNADTAAYCYIGTEKINHDVVIVGWDDNYSRENFHNQPESDGAFLCMNSWGDSFGQGGYFYISYDDTYIGIYNTVYTRVDGTDNYDHIYQADPCGAVGQMGFNDETAYFAAAYQTGGTETLDAVGFYATDANTTYEIYLVRQFGSSEDLHLNQKLASGTFANAGYYTVDLDPVLLDAGERFAVIIKITTPGAVYPVAIEFAKDEKTASVTLDDGETYASMSGENWQRLEETQSCNACLKVYTSDAQPSRTAQERE